MENASKALLIAASVLIVILLVALGMRIFNNSAGTAADDATATAQSISSQSQMAVYSQYIGTIPGSQVTDLLTKLKAQSVIKLEFYNKDATTGELVTTAVTKPAKAIPLVNLANSYVVKATAAAGGGYSLFTVTEK